MDEKIKDYLKMHDSLYNDLHKLLDSRNNAKYVLKDDKKAEELESKIKDKQNEIDQFTDIFSKYIYNMYAFSNPKIFDDFNNKTSKFTDVFGKDFDNMPKTLKDGLIGLFKDTGRYKLK